MHEARIAIWDRLASRIVSGWSLAITQRLRGRRADRHVHVHALPTGGDLGAVRLTRAAQKIIRACVGWAYICAVLRRGFGGRRQLAVA